MEFDEVQIVILTSAIVIIAFLGIFITLFSIFQKKKVSFILREKEKEKEFEKTLHKSQNEIRETALKNIAWELHDNVGQLLSLAKLELNILQPNVPVKNKEKVHEISNLIGETLQEIRSLSKTLNHELINNMGLIQSIGNEINRFNRLEFIEAIYTVKGEAFEIANEDEVILFRILQEFFSNTIKHSQATKLEVTMNYSPTHLVMTAEDNGKGYNVETIEKGSGLINMQSRAALINTSLNCDSNENGTKIEIIYLNKKH